jgi:hypothetical protein
MKSVVIAALFAWGCRSASHFDGLDTQANPTLSRLRTTVAPLLEHGGPQLSEAERAHTCIAGISELEPIRDVDFRDRALAVRQHAPTVHEIVVTLLDHSSTICSSDTYTDVISQCSKWCVERWNTLATRLEVVRAAAADEHVQIESLRVSR